MPSLPSNIKVTTTFPAKLDFSRRLNILHQPFSDELSPGYFKICWHLANNKNVVIESDSQFVTVNNVQMDIFTLVRYLFFRRRGQPARACDYEAVYQSLKLFQLSL